MPDKEIALAQSIARLAAEQGGRAYYVGGAVRDRLLHRENKDIDLEVHGLRPRQLEAILDSLGRRLAVGESFGIYQLKGSSLDIAMPRKEGKRGAGQGDLDDCVDPFIGTLGAARRRDFTCNALMEDVLTGEIIDHFGGRADLERGVLRHVDDVSFAEDPLRVLRAAQFAARFGFGVADKTLALCRSLDLTALPRERVMGEVEKALMRSEKPSVFFETLRRMEQLSFWFAELEQTIGVGQDPVHHAEGDVWTHTMMVLDRAAAYRQRAEDPLALMLAAVTHDFGKILCTETVNGRVHAYRHETLGLPLAERFLRRLTADKTLIRCVLSLTALHMKPHMLAADGASIKSTNRMFDQTAAPEALICLALSDALGKLPPGDCPAQEAFLLQRLETYRDYMARPYVTGRDLIEAGVAPSERFSDYLAYAHKLRLAGVTKENALRQTLAMARKEEDHERSDPE